MKRTYFAVLTIAALALAGCTKTESMSGTAVRFGAGTKGEPLTKTAYGDFDQTPNPTMQMIDWVEGDVIRVTCAQASTDEGAKTYADYKTSAGTKHGTESRATLSLNSNNDKGLRWGSESDAHIFYGVYPSPYIKSGDELSTAGALTGSIPQTQSVSVSGSSAPYTATYDMTNQYLVAKRTVDAGKQSFGDDEVWLYFTPITTTIEFTVQNVMTEDLVIDNIEILSENRNLSGTFTTSLTALSETGGTYPTVTGASNLAKTANVSFGTTGLTLAPNEVLTFTIFLLPEADLDDLTFRINRKGTGAGYIQTKLATSATEYYTFERCKKHFVRGLLAQDGAKWGFGPLLAPWKPVENQDALLEGSDLFLDASLVPWEAGTSTNVALVDEYTYDFSFGTSYDATDITASETFRNTSSASDTENISIYSKRKPGGGTGTPENHGWKILSYRIGSGDAVEVDGTSFTGGGLNVSADVANNRLSVTADYRESSNRGANSYWRNPSGRTDNLAWSPANWIGYGPIDLSKYDFQTDTREAHRMTTANCYIIRHAGTYRIPLVYGNGVVDGEVNKSSYDSGERGANVLQKFKNHMGKDIVDPFIENGNKKKELDKVNLDPEGNDRLKANSCEIVWKDADVISGLKLLAAPELIKPKGKPRETYSADKVRYLEFTVRQEDICQSNAVIAVRRTEAPEESKGILWSWHIWITNDPAVGNEPVEVINAANRDYYFFPLGTLGMKEADQYPGREDVTVYLEQETSGKIIEVLVSQPDVFGNGTGVFYQWGRKDPMPGSSLTGYSQTAGPKSIPESIKKPGTFYTISSSGDWCSTSYKNLWTGRYTGTDEAEKSSTMVKTIYDPSPVGYKVPAPKAFSGFLTTNTEGDYDSGWNYYTAPSGSAGDPTIFFFGNGYDDRKDGVKHDSGNGFYWSSVTDNSVDSGRSFKFSSSTSSTTANSKSEGFSVRPVTEY